MSTAEARHTSYWTDTTPRTAYPPLTADVDVDVAVVGGGIAGLFTAWEAVRAGASVVLVEAGRIAEGTTGHTTAKVSALHGLRLGRLADVFGTETALAYGRDQREAVEYLANTAAGLGVDCELERRWAYTYVTRAERVDEIHREVDLAQRAGLPAAFTTDTALPFGVVAAIRVKEQLQFHPRRFLLALAEDLCRRGGRIFEHSRAVDLAEGEPCVLTVEAGGRARARRVAVCTHYPVFDRLKIFPRLTVRREFVVAAPIDETDDPGGMYVTPEDDVRSVRTAPYGPGRRLLIVTGESHAPGEGGERERRERLAEWTRSRFKVDGLAYRWSAQDTVTADGLPYIGRLSGGPAAYVATGFDGWGMTNGVVAGLILGAHVAGTAPDSARMYDPARLHPRSETGELVRTAASVAGHLVGDRIRPPGAAGSLAGIAPGTGAVIRHGGERVAVYRDDDGVPHAVAAECTHLGCVVAFNDDERSWDCPCHGSRYGTDGAVLHGPAVEPLEARDVTG